MLYDTINVIKYTNTKIVFIAPHHITPHHTTPHHTTPHHTTPHHTAPHNTTPHHITPHHITQQGEMIPAVIIASKPLLPILAPVLTRESTVRDESVNIISNISDSAIDVPGR